MSVEEVVIPDDIHDFLLWRSWKTVTTATGEFFEKQVHQPARPAQALINAYASAFLDRGARYRAEDRKNV